MNACYKLFKASLCPVLIGICLALFSLTPQGGKLEEDFGLSWLFKLRGSLQAPKKVIIISLDKVSAEILHLPDNPEKWPRSYYAQLIEKLNQQNPSLIAFNMIFSESRDKKSDQLLTKAMLKRKNTILSNYLKRSSIQKMGSSNNFKYERVIDLIPDFAQVALGSAPFPLPKTASTVKQFWTYKNSAGDIATFPVAIFQCFVFKQVYPQILQLLHQLKSPYNFQLPTSFEQLAESSDVLESIQRIQLFLTRDYQLLEQLDQLIQSATYPSYKKKLLNSWLALMKNPYSLHFNHYGAAGTITTIPFYQALVSDFLNPELFDNKIIMVGYSENLEPEKSPGLYSVFSRSNNDIVSPIEIAATAVANLIDDSWIKPLQPLYQFLLLSGWSILLFGICQHYRYRLAIGLVIALNLAYLAFAYAWFIKAFIWIPLFIPILLLTPLVLIIKSISYFLESKHEQLKMQQAFSLYLPDDVVKSMTHNHDIDNMNQFGELMQGACMATDAGQYTTLSESMNPQHLNDLMNNYYGVMFPQVKIHKGIISDVTGDAMFAIWSRSEQNKLDRINACKAALKISMDIEQFNHSQPHQLPTRMGLHFGDIRLGNLGAAGHFEYRAVGDTVNTAARIEGLNKLLGTKILISANVINDLSGFFTREMGFFILRGKTHPIRIYELIAEITEQQNLYRSPGMSRFSSALELFQQQQWSEALALWQAIERNYPGYGPTRFYIHYLNQGLHLAEPHDPTHPTVIKIGNITIPLDFKDVMRLE